MHVYLLRACRYTRCGREVSSSTEAIRVWGGFIIDDACNTTICRSHKGKRAVDPSAYRYVQIVCLDNSDAHGVGPAYQNAIPGSSSCTCIIVCVPMMGSTPSLPMYYGCRLIIMGCFKLGGWEDLPDVGIPHLAVVGSWGYYHSVPLKICHVRPFHGSSNGGFPK